MGNTDLWDKLGKTDPEHTKAFSRAGGFRGTAIKPMASYRLMTEEYGACGIGWGVNEPTFQVVPAGDEILVFCTVSIWHGTKEQTVFGVGGDKVVVKYSTGLKSDDEAFKKAFTDAVTNALKLIGVGADVHMGLFDDNKYVSETKAEFAEKRQNPHVTRAADVFPVPDYDKHGQPIDNIPLASADVRPLPKKDAKGIFEQLQKELHAHGIEKELMAWGERSADRVGSLPSDWQDIFRGMFKEHRAAIREQDLQDEKRMAS